MKKKHSPLVEGGFPTALEHLSESRQPRRYIGRGGISDSGVCDSLPFEVDVEESSEVVSMDNDYNVGRRTPPIISH